MATLITLKRSLNTAVPASLANGEPAFTANGDVFYIGSNNSIVPIAGKRTPGTLTANQALVSNSTSYIDIVKTGKLFLTDTTANVQFINSVANSTVIGAAANTEITTTWAIKTYVDAKVAGVTGSPGGANTQVQFNNSGVFGAGAGFTFDNSTNNAVIANTLTVNVLGGAQINSAANLSVTSANISFLNANLSVKDINVSGNLVVSGTVTSIDATNLNVTDSTIKLARSNAGNVLDIGFYGQYNDGSTRFTGLLYDASASLFELFANTTVEPTTTVDTAAADYASATLKTLLNARGLVVNTSAVTVTANSTYNVNITGNTLSLTTALPGTSGGTGYTSYAAEDLLIANTTNGFRKLSFVASKVLQSNETAILFDDLDGGTF